MSQDKLNLQLVQSLKSYELNDLAILYLNEVEDQKNIISCDGTGDSGLDLRPASFDNITIQYQATTQAKLFAGKLKLDLTKAKENVDNYQLPKRVFYFYSYPLTSDAILGYRKMAKDEYGINLNIIEANAIAQIATIYNSLSSFLIETAELEKYKQENSEYFSDSKVKAFYDLMSFGATTDIKYNIIKSFVLNFLFNSGETKIVDVLIKVNSHFSSDFSEDYFGGIIRRLSTERRIYIKKQVDIELREEEKARIDRLLEDYRIEEALLKKNLTEVLERYLLVDEVDTIIEKLAHLYESNYSVNLGEFTHRQSNFNDLKSATESFESFIKSKLEFVGSDCTPSKLANEIVQISDEFEILSRIAIGSVYSKVSNPERLNDYISQHHNNKGIFLDTNVIINLLLVYYEWGIEYDNYHYKISKELIQFIKSNDLHPRTIRSYVLEVANIFEQAVAIIPFTKLPIFEDLGGSKNILYNFYIFLKTAALLHEGVETFEEFLAEYNIKPTAELDNHPYFSRIKYLLEDVLNIEVEHPKHYDIGETKKLMQRDLRDHTKTKSSFAINNDSIMFDRLGDKDSSVNPVDPIFCTWDKSLNSFRKKYFEENPSCTKWLMYTPTRLMDHFSMLNLQVKHGTLTNEVLSILEEDFSFQEKTQTLLDSMLTIINPNNSIGLKYVTELANLRNQEILQVDRKHEDIPDEQIDTNPVDKVLHDLFLKYMISEEEDSLDKLKKVFTKEEFYDEIFSLLSKMIKTVAQTGSVEPIQFEDMDKIVVKSASQ